MKLSELKKMATENGISLKHLTGKMLKKSELAEKLMTKGVMVKSPKKSRKTSRKPKKTSRKPKKTSRKPKKTSRKPVKKSRKPKKTSRKPVKKSRKPVKKSRKPKKTSRKPKKTSRKPKKTSRKPKKTSRKPKKTSRKPVKKSRKPKKVRKYKAVSPIIEQPIKEALRVEQSNLLQVNRVNRIEYFGKYGVILKFVHKVDYKVEKYYYEIDKVTINTITFEVINGSIHIKNTYYIYPVHVPSQLDNQNFFDKTTTKNIDTTATHLAGTVEKWLNIV
jgi:hypothetical protein